LDEAYETGRKACDEGQAILEEVRSGDVIGDDIMGDETAHAMQMQDKNDIKQEGHEEKKSWFVDATFKIILSLNNSSPAKNKN
jgi:hypothetical protein